MMAFTELRIGDQVIRYDREKTQQAYNTFDKRFTDTCGCIDCQNFAAQRDSAFPESFRRLLCDLGIDPSREGEVYAGGPTGDRKVSYGGWFYLVGEMTEPGERAAATGGVKHWFTASFPAAPAFQGEPVLAIEFEMAINWVLDARPDWESWQ